MAEFSATHYDASSIDIISGHSVGALSGAAISGRALSNISHTSGGGLRYFEVECVALPSSGSKYFGVGIVDSTASLTQWIGQGTNLGVYMGASGDNLSTYTSGGSSGAFGGSILAVGSRIGIWVNCSSRKAWVTSRPRNGWLIGNSGTALPAAGTGPSWTVPGTGNLQIAVTPGFGSGSDRNIVRLRTKRSEFLNAELYGALPWGARTSSVSIDLVDAAGAPIATSTAVSWAWFDEVTPDVLTAPADKGTAVVGASGNLALSVITSLEVGEIGWLVISTSDGTETQCSSHAMPVAAP